MTVPRIDIGEETYFADSKRVRSIDYHTPQWEGDIHYADIHFTNGKVVRYFNDIRMVVWEEEIPNNILKAMLGDGSLT